MTLDLHSRAPPGARRYEQEIQSGNPNEKCTNAQPPSIKQNGSTQRRAHPLTCPLAADDGLRKKHCPPSRAAQTSASGEFASPPQKDSPRERPFISRFACPRVGNFEAADISRGSRRRSDPRCSARPWVATMTRYSESPSTTFQHRRYCPLRAYSSHVKRSAVERDEFAASTLSGFTLESPDERQVCSSFP